MLSGCGVLTSGLGCSRFGILEFVSSLVGQVWSMTCTDVEEHSADEAQEMDNDSQVFLQQDSESGHFCILGPGLFLSLSLGIAVTVDFLAGLAC